MSLKSLNELNKYCKPSDSNGYKVDVAKSMFSDVGEICKLIIGGRF